MKKKPFYHSPEAANPKTKESLGKIVSNKNIQEVTGKAEGAMGVFSTDEVAEKARKEAINWLTREKKVKITNIFRPKDWITGADRAISNVAGDQKPTRRVTPDGVEELPSDEILAEILDKGEENAQKPPKQRFGRN